MALSATTSFNLEVSEIAEEAFEQIGLECKSGYDLRTARTSLNLMLLDWQNKGVNLWTITEEYVEEDVDGNTLTTPTWYLDKGVKEYRIKLGTTSLFDVVLRTNDGTQASQQDFVLTRLSQPDYAMLPNKITQARPLQYYFDRKEIQDTGSSTDQYSTITLWPVPDKDSEYAIKYWRMRRMDDTGGLASNTMQVPDRFLPALVSGLAYRIAKKKSGNDERIMQKLPILKQEAEGEFLSASEEDRVKTSMHMKPDITMYSARR